MKTGKIYAVMLLQSAALLFLALFYHAVISSRAKTPELTDFYRFYKSAESYLEGTDIYALLPYTPTPEYSRLLTDEGRASLTRMHPNLNSPLHVLSIVPFALLPFEWAYRGWSILALVIILAVSCQIPLPPYPQNLARYYRIGIFILLLGYFPTIANMLLGQYGLVLLGLMILLWRTSRKGDMRLAGLILGIAMSVKIFTGLFLLFYAFRRQWRAVIWGSSVYIALNIFGVFLFGWSTYKQHIALISEGKRYINASWNASLPAFFSRIFGGAENIPLWDCPQLAAILSGACILFLIIMLRWFSQRIGAREKVDNHDLGFSYTMIAMLLISPFAWIYYFPMLLIPLVVAWRLSLKLPSRKTLGASIVAIWIASTFPTLLISSEEIALNQPIVWFANAGVYCYALIAFAALFITLNNALTANASILLARETDSLAPVAADEEA